MIIIISSSSSSSNSSSSSSSSSSIIIVFISICHYYVCGTTRGTTLHMQCVRQSPSHSHWWAEGVNQGKDEVMRM